VKLFNYEVIVNPIRSLSIEKLQIQIYPDKPALGQAAAEWVTELLDKAVSKGGHANLILATGASQFEFLAAFKKMTVAWDRITVFHLDEYKGMSITHPASFRKYLQERILDEVKPKQVYLLNGDSKDLDAELVNYERLLAESEIDVACIGIGENGHIAFNDPAVADFKDPRLVKVVDLDEACRKQQLGEGWFPTLADVPIQALSLTIPAIMRCRAISCVVPDQRKANAVRNAVYGPLSTACPASILRTHANTVLFLDQDSAGGL
jgi:glucosamine-6-phosphate deaminase